MKAGKLLRPLLTFAVLAIALAVPSVASARTFTVTTGDGSGPGSLRQAVVDANATPGHDTIDFSPNVHTVTVAADQLGPMEITGDMEIDGPGRDKLKVLGSGGRAFVVNGSGKATIAGMTFTQSAVQNDVGGAVLNGGNLVLDDVLMEGNSAIAHPGAQASGGALANTGTLTLMDSTLMENSTTGEAGPAGIAGGVSSGGAILNSGTLTIDDSTLINNAARAGSTTTASPRGVMASGGAIQNSGDLTVLDSTLSSNAATGGDGRMEGGTGVGGAIYNSGRGTLTLRRSTLNGNTAGGGSGNLSGIGAGGGVENIGQATFRLENSTITANWAAPGHGGARQQSSFGGGIDNQTSAPTTILASTIAANVAWAGANIIDDSRKLSVQDTIVSGGLNPLGEIGGNCGHRPGPDLNITSLGYNIQSGTSCGFSAVGDRSSTDPQLKPLADNGGPTQTMAIPLSSPALDQGVSGGLTTDERRDKRPVIVPGVPRPEGGDGSDIGAYEYRPGPGGHSRITGSVKPGRTHVGERTCFKFKAKHSNGGPMKKAQVKFAGKRARTDQRGKATICKRFKDSRVRHPRIRKRGHERAELRVNVRP